VTPAGHRYEWDRLVPHFVHPLKVVIIEAMSWVEEPISPRDLDMLLEEEFGVSLVAYHVRGLVYIGAVEKVGQRAVRGALQSFYVLAAKEPAGAAVTYE